MNCIFLRRGYPESGPKLPDPGTPLNDMSWEDISTIAGAGLAQEYFAVGDTKKIILNGKVGTLSLSNYETYVYIIGFNHNGAENVIDFGTFKTADGKDIALVDSKYDNYATDGTKYFSMNHTTNTNSGGWKGCELRYDVLGSTKTKNANAPETTTTSPVSGTLMAAMPEDLRAVMKPMTIYSNNSGGSNTTITTTVDYLPLLAEYEVMGVRSQATTTEKNYQQQYAYYSQGKSKVKYRHSSNGKTAIWRLRSTVSGNTTNFVHVATSGSADSQQAVFSYGLAPIFRV